MLIFDDEMFITYCMSIYKTPFYSDEEFKTDVNKTIVIKKLFRRFLDKGTINERLVLNTLITFTNVFGVNGANNILFYKMPPEFYSILKAFLEFLNMYVVTEETVDIISDSKIHELLKVM